MHRLLSKVFSRITAHPAGTGGRRVNRLRPRPLVAGQIPIPMKAPVTPQTMPVMAPYRPWRIGPL
ncbi:Predicted protein (fragment) [Acidithiobacillus ferrivorans]|uniref:Uncharacterized protein n=1 Tax=Acidithiobacillus ferrivorans TaxID=160808 RepID=A0A060UYZ9_9PROT